MVIVETSALGKMLADKIGGGARCGNEYKHKYETGIERSIKIENVSETTQDEIEGLIESHYISSNSNRCNKDLLMFERNNDCELVVATYLPDITDTINLTVTSIE